MELKRKEAAAEKIVPARQVEFLFFFFYFFFFFLLNPLIYLIFSLNFLSISFPLSYFSFSFFLFLFLFLSL